MSDFKDFDFDNDDDPFANLGSNDDSLFGLDGDDPTLFEQTPGFGDSAGDSGADFSDFDDDFATLNDEVSFESIAVGDDMRDEMPSMLFADTEEDIEAQAEPTNEGGVSRTFLAIAGAMLLLFLVVIGLIVFFIFSNQDSGPSELEQTATSIVQTNAAIAIAGQQTSTAIAQFDLTNTAVALFTDTPTVTPTNTRPPTNTPTPTSDATEAAATSFVLSQTQSAQTAEAQSLALTADALTAIAQPTTTPTRVSSDTVAQTSTALAQVFLNLTATADALANLGQGGGSDSGATPTVELLTPIATSTSGGSTTLPNSGLFDEFAAGNSFGILSIAAVGLVGIILGARYIRSRNDEDDQNNA
ncbi:MAG: hypothetical protein ACOYLB_03845 [Phototrophicaceae bacterium]